MPAWYKVASTPAAVRYLLEMVAPYFGIMDDLTEDNAAETLLALRELIFPQNGPTLDTEEKQQAAAETFEKLEKHNAG